MRARQLFKLTASARGFVLGSVVLGALFVARDTTTLVCLILLAVFFGLGQYAAWRPRFGVTYTPAVEAAFVGLVAGLALESTELLLGAMTVAPFVAALQYGLRGLAAAASSGLLMVLVGSVFADSFESGAQGMLTWTVTGIGLGLIAEFVRGTLGRVPTEVAPYLAAQELLRELISLSSGLSSGLDVNTLGGEILSAVRDEIPVDALALYVPGGESVVPVISKSSSGEELLGPEEHRMTSEAWLRSDVVVLDRFFAFRVGDRAMVSGLLSDRVDPTSLDLPGTIGGLRASLEVRSVQLDTALLFARFRDTATADERQRLAREMHDGVAQDIASLGYLVDAIAAKPATEKQAEQFQVLRGRITNIVAEVRRSVLTLRTSIGENESLGAAIGSVARHLNERSGVPIQVTLDEHPGRLREEVEAELFRIAQEAMNNAIKHAHASVIDVHCRVRAPAASVTVSDDGRGLGQARSDSYGLRIMRERAHLVGGRLSISENERGGVTVHVEIADHEARPSPSTTPTSPATLGT